MYFLPFIMDTNILVKRNANRDVDHQQDGILEQTMFIEKISMSKEAKIIIIILQTDGVAK